MFITPSFKKSLIVEQFQGNYLKQGDSLPPYLFIIAAEMLAIAIKTNREIHGLWIGRKEFKSVQYADDLTVLVPNIECAKHVFQLLDVFQSCSDLKVNYTKTKVIWIGSSRDKHSGTPEVDMVSER